MFSYRAAFWGLLCCMAVICAWSHRFGLAWYVALIEFGNEAYVVTPFTHDYDNVLLSMALIGDWSEFMQFPDGGTAIGRAIDRGVGLFKAFNFLNAAGNAMIMFTDGRDDEKDLKGKPISVGAPKSVARIVLRCLEKRPDDRFQSANDLAFALDELDAMWMPVGMFSSTISDSGMLSRYFTSARRLLPCAAITTRLPALTSGAIVSSQ